MGQMRRVEEEGERGRGGLSGVAWQEEARVGRSSRGLCRARHASISFQPLKHSFFFPRFPQPPPSPANYDSTCLAARHSPTISSHPQHLL